MEKDVDTKRKFSGTNVTSNVSDMDSDSKASSHIKNIDLYDRLNFQRVQFKRNSVKFKTNVCSKSKLNIEKFTDEITKIVEDIEIPVTEKSRKRTIKFATQKVTFQYPKDKEQIKSVFSQNDDGDKNDNLDEKDENKKSDINIFTFEAPEEDDDEDNHTHNHNHDNEIVNENVNKKDSSSNIHVKFGTVNLDLNK